MFNFDWTKRTHKGLRKWILYIVRDVPKSGVEIMDTMEANLQGWWRPSPGSVYPMLKNMVGEGVLDRSDDDKYALTAAGREEIEKPWFQAEAGAPQPRSVDGAVEVISSYTSYLEDLARSKDKDVAKSAVQIRELADRLARVGKS
ncbi:MAG: PadR family transcriptional regulator [Nitrososphaerota archaeon]|nr:PadR family transcriptional regulator [Nitrososphaerota archaeon]